VNRNFELSKLVSGAAAIVITAALPVQAAPTRITGVQVAPSDRGAEVILTTRNGDRPQVFTVNRGNALVADLINTQLQLEGNQGFVQNHPAAGITSVSVTQLDANSVRVVVTGQTDPPSGEVLTAGNQVVLQVAPTGNGQPSPPDASLSAPDPDVVAAPLVSPPAAESEVLVPNPGLTIDGVPIVESSPQPYVPPTLPAPVPPPIGDIATSTIDTSPLEVDLGTTETVSRLVLRDAPVREVLALLARAAQLNIAYIDESAAAATDGTTPAEEVRISLDIENEPVQSVFNYVIRIANLDVNRVGRTIFVGPRLPNSARQVIARTLRLNQVEVDSAVAFLVGLGAETAVTRERLVTTVTAAPITTESGAVATDAEARQTEQAEETRIEVQRVDYADSDPLLRGLQVIADARTNSVTLVGAPRQVQIAASQLSQLDIRRRQAAINVRVIDVNLLGVDRVSTSFSFGINDTNIAVDSGVGLINFGSSTAENFPVNLGGPDSVSNLIIPSNNDDYEFVNNFLAQLRMAVTSGNAKILTDPTLVVQEGQVAQVQLTEDVVTNFRIERQGTGDTRTETIEIERTPAGLILDVQVDRIDDNGFVSLSVAPAISAPTATQEFEVLDSEIEVTLLSVRRVSSGQVRIRDGQTLILSGIIQDQDRATVTKVPLLGDIPVLGTLFRSTTRQNQRQEVIVLLTPHIMDDSDTSTFGYRYTPQPETQDYLQQQNIQMP
jgi:type IV pilus assembly protein PilQ